MKLSDIEVGETYYLSGNAPTDIMWQDPQKEPYLRLMETVVGDVLESDNPEFREQAEHMIARFGPEAATVRQVLKSDMRYPTAEARAVGVPYKKGCHGIMFHGPEGDFTVHFSALRSEGELVEEWEADRERVAATIGTLIERGMDPNHELLRRRREAYGL